MKAPGRFATLGVAAALAVGGALTLQRGLNPSAPPTPDLTAAVSAPANQRPVGPSAAPVAAAPGAKARVAMSPERMTPNHLFIPAKGIYAPIDERYGAVERRQLTLPPASKVARRAGAAAVPSPAGNLVIAGHVAEGDAHGALYELANVPLGARGWVTDARGVRQEFQLQSLTPYKKKELPASLWVNKGPKQLVLITCGGELHRAGGRWHFDSNVVALWRPVAPPVSP